MKIQIRQYKLGDLKHIEQLMDAFEDYLVEIDNLKRLRRKPGFGKKYTALVFKKIQRNKGKIFVATIEDQVVGFIGGLLEEQEPEDKLEVGRARYGRIQELYVDERFRGNGIGTLLIEAMEKYFASKKCDVISIEVFAPNKNAHEIYSHLGYVNRSVDLIKIVKQ